MYGGRIMADEKFLMDAYNFALKKNPAMTGERDGDAAIIADHMAMYAKEKGIDLKLKDAREFVMNRPDPMKDATEILKNISKEM